MSDIEFTEQNIRKAIDDMFESVLNSGKQSNITNYLVNHLTLSVDDLVELFNSKRD